MSIIIEDVKIEGCWNCQYFTEKYIYDHDAGKGEFDYRCHKNGDNKKLETSYHPCEDFGNDLLPEIVDVKEFSHDRQPYGCLTFEVELGKCRRMTKEESMYGWLHGHYVVEGIVTEGGTTSRIFHHTSTRSEVGNFHQVTHVCPSDVFKRHHVTVAM